jgi:hypothetical protein
VSSGGTTPNISVTNATAAAKGVVQVDGTTITAAAGVISAVAAAGALTRIAQQVLGAPAATVTFSGIAATFSNLMLTIVTRSSNASFGDTIYMQANGDTGANYTAQNIVGSGAAATAAASNGVAQAGVSACSAASAPANCPGGSSITVPGYAQTTFLKTAVAQSMQINTASFPVFVAGGWVWSNTAAINALKLGLTSGANFNTGSVFTLYGIS